ncbi:O-methyltransferase [Goodfellowiella coeruleoviolacea]|uniref:O-methyltransferase n=2 Tax=Goodfellowiella coeruleoviolacea TaxID=334858 RepID=A0AAE3GHV1_9PSEU|nr:O-methyltransferase [Goodfellowiella coeruleoviolacea]
MTSLVTPWVLRTAVTLRLPDLIAAGVTNTTELATRAGANPDALQRVIRHLIHCRVLRQAGPDRVELTALGEFLRTDHPARLANTLDQNNPYNRREAAVLTRLPDAVRTGQPVWASCHGHDFWADLNRDEALASGFDHALAGFPDFLAGRIARGYDWTSARHVVDVGGGTGRVLAELLTTHPRLRGTLVDLPHAAALAAARFAEQGVADRASVSGQTFFDPLPTGGDVYLLANVLHCWTDEDSRKIIDQCVASAAPRAVVVVVDQVMPEQPTGGDQRGLDETDLGLLLLFGTKIRSEREFRRLGDSAGLTLRGCTAIAPADGWSLLTYTVDD